ncbi:MAG: hypothetical protein M3Q48_14540 [Actinomycetota bacterium]|nr:hypothetical protein [Actinomycetota bacterium]
MARALRRRPAVALLVAGLFVVAALVALHAGGGSSRARAGGAPAVPGAVVGPSGVQPSTASKADALAAGVRFATLMAEMFPLDSAAARETVEEVASDAYRPALTAAIDAELAPLQRQVAGLAGRPIYRQSVLAAKLGSYAPPRAQLSAWVMVTAGQAQVDANAMATFAIVTVDLVFERGGWRLDRTSETPGPSPQLRDAPSTADVLTARLQGFADWRPAA